MDYELTTELVYATNPISAMEGHSEFGEIGELEGINDDSTEEQRVQAFKAECFTYDMMTDAKRISMSDLLPGITLTFLDVRQRRMLAAKESASAPLIPLKEADSTPSFKLVVFYHLDTNPDSKIAFESPYYDTAREAHTEGMELFVRYIQARHYLDCLKSSTPSTPEPESEPQTQAEQAENGNTTTQASAEPVYEQEASTEDLQDEAHPDLGASDQSS